MSSYIMCSPDNILACGDCLLIKVFLLMESGMRFHTTRYNRDKVSYFVIELIVLCCSLFVLG